MENSRPLGETPIIRDHYPFITRLLIDLFRAGELSNVERLDIEPVYGYCGRILYCTGAVRLYKGSSLGINNLGASEVSKDKGYTKYFLEQLGYNTPVGKVFLFPKFLNAIDRNLGRFGFIEYSPVTEILDYIEKHIGYPCYIKPNEGSQGRGVERCETIIQVQEAVFRLEEMGISKLIVENAVDLPDFRVVVLGDQVISCYLRKPLAVVGDGHLSVFELVEKRQRTFEREGRDTIIDVHDVRITSGLSQKGYSWSSVLPNGVSIQLYAPSNLSLGGDSQDFTNAIHPHWQSLCIRVARDMGLRFCGVDIACEDITSPSSSASILEINAAPGLDNYAVSGIEQADIVRKLYAKVFNEIEL